MTVYDYIRQRWPEHCQRIIECAMEQDKAGAEYTLTRLVSEKKDIRRYYPHISNVLDGLFLWDNTTEGHAYWKALSEQGERV